jgi:abhydrolase domain-containing protein 6
MEDKTITVDGIRTRYVDEGSGPPVVFIHGLGGYKENWETNVPVFSARHRVIALDLPGFGESEKPDVPYAPPWHADFVVKFLGALGIGRANLVGNSMGGHISSFIGATRPEMVEKIVLADPSGVLGAELAEGAISADLVEAMGPVNPGEDFIRLFMSIIFFKQGPYSEKMVKRALADFERGENEIRFRAYVRSMRGLLEHDMTEHYPKIKAPTMVIWGENDGLIPVKHAGVIAPKIPGSRKILIPECGHCPMIEKPDEFNRIVLEFLDSGAASS